jgi:hypothetical protein
MMSPPLESAAGPPIRTLVLALQRFCATLPGVGCLSEVAKAVSAVEALAAEQAAADAAADSAASRAADANAEHSTSDGSNNPDDDNANANADGGPRRARAGAASTAATGPQASAATAHARATAMRDAALVHHLAVLCDTLRHGGSRAHVALAHCRGVEVLAEVAAGLVRRAARARAEAEARAPSLALGEGQPGESETRAETRAENQSPSLALVESRPCSDVPASDSRSASVAVDVDGVPGSLRAARFMALATLAHFLLPPVPGRPLTLSRDLRHIEAVSRCVEWIMPLAFDR